MNHALKDTPRYQALSYTWGSTWDRGDISIENKPLQVSQNLANFCNLIAPNKDGGGWIRHASTKRTHKSETRKSQ